LQVCQSLDREVLVGITVMSTTDRSGPHESAVGHVTGSALYTDDLAGRFPDLLHAWPVLAPHAHARVRSLDATPALDEPGVVTTLTARRSAW
jgi:xanthine dehydrogenase large subunit